MQVYFIDVFTDELFKGNTAAVVPLSGWLPDAQMQQMAAQHQLSETVFFIPRGDGFDIRWFTPAAEVDLCGHATLASAYVLWNILGYPVSHILFHSKSGPLKVTRNNGDLTLDFPMDYFLEQEAPEKMVKALGKTPTASFIGKDNYLLVYDNEEDIRHMQPNFMLLQEVKAHGIIVTARGRSVDYVFRFFAPSIGVNEDPATGSAQTTLTNYWSKRLDKEQWTSLQLSARGGSFVTSIENDRVLITGQAVLYLTGEIHMP